YDYPCTPTGKEDRAPDGQIFVEVRAPDGSQTFVPQDELVLKDDAKPKATPPGATQHTPGAGQTSGSAPHQAPGGGIQQARGGGQRTPGARPTPKPLPIIDMSKWDILPAEPRHWLVYDRIPRRQPTMLSGHGEAGKSTLLLQLLCSTALGRDWIGLLPE